VFIDSLVLLDILPKWGKHNYNPGPNDVILFDRILPILHELWQSVGKVVLVKVKSHTGCLLYEQADKLDELGCASEEPTLCPGPNKYGSRLAENQPS
jgi:hypothetical protein